jgi:hypothetical protein
MNRNCARLHVAITVAIKRRPETRSRRLRMALTCGLSGGQGRGRTADLPIFSRTLVPTELPGRVPSRETASRGLACGPDYTGRWRVHPNPGPASSAPPKGMPRTRRFGSGVCRTRHEHWLPRHGSRPLTAVAHNMWHPRHAWAPLRRSAKPAAGSPQPGHRSRPGHTGANQGTPEPTRARRAPVTCRSTRHTPGLPRRRGWLLRGR